MVSNHAMPIAVPFRHQDVRGGTVQDTCEVLQLERSGTARDLWKEPVDRGQGLCGRLVKASDTDARRGRQVWSSSEARNRRTVMSTVRRRRAAVWRGNATTWVAHRGAH